MTAPGAPAREWALVAAVFAAVALVAAVWLAVDRRPPEWDHANHLERAVLCARDLGTGDARAILERSSFYPPLVICAAGLAYRLVPSDAVAAQAVVLAFLGLGMAATYFLGRRLAGGTAGVVAALLFGTAPFVVFSTLRFQLDLPLAAMVALALWAALESEGFDRRGWALATGVFLGLGMLTKPPFAAYVLPPLLVVLARLRGRHAAVNAVAAGTVAMAISLPWYGPRLAGLPLQVAARSFKQAAESGHPDPLTWSGLALYPTWFPTQFGVVAALLLVAGLVLAARRRQWLLLAALLVPFVLFELLRNKNLRYTLPLLPVASVVAGIAFSALRGRARTVVAAALIAAAAVQVSGTVAGVPADARLPGLGVPWVIASPPMLDDWKHREILALITRASRGAPATVSVVPNFDFFSVSNFRYYGLRDGRPLRFTRAWDESPLGVDYMVLKSGDVGPSWTAERPRRIAGRLASDPDLDRVFPSIGEFLLPDGSRATVRARQVPPVAVAAPVVARALETAIRDALPAFARDVDGLALALDWDESIVRGRIRRVELRAASATVGELRKRDAATLRLRELRLSAEDVLLNPHSAVAVGRLDPLDAGRFTLERATITAGDLQAFLGGLRRYKGTSIVLEEGAVRITVVGRGPTVSARLRIAAAADRPFALAVDRLRYGGVPVPSVLVNWVARNYDPTPRLAARLPVPVGIGQVTIAADAIRIAR